MSLAVVVAALALTVHTFCWEPSVGATGYRVYWSSGSDIWASGHRIETTELCVDDPVGEPVPGEIVYYIVTAFDADGESETEHGPIV